jgi:hypothetical protein
MFPFGNINIMLSMRFLLHVLFCKHIFFFAFVSWFDVSLLPFLSACSRTHTNIYKLKWSM